MDANDTLYVVDSTNNSASWYNLNSKASEYIKESWSLRKAA
jgi:hypothetical protein